MASRQIAKGLKRSALTIALGVCFAGAVHAQSAVGSINGEAPAGSSVTITNADTGVTRTLTTDANGRFTFPQLAPGRYTVTSGGHASSARGSKVPDTPIALMTGCRIPRAYSSGSSRMRIARASFTGTCGRRTCS